MRGHFWSTVPGKAWGRPWWPHCPRDQSRLGTPHCWSWGTRVLRPANLALMNGAPLVFCWNEPLIKRLNVIKQVQPHRGTGQTQGCHQVALCPFLRLIPSCLCCCGFRCLADPHWSLLFLCVKDGADLLLCCSCCENGRSFCLTVS